MSLSLPASQVLNNHPVYSQFINEAVHDPDILAVYQYGSSVSEKRFRDVDLCIITLDNNPNAFFKKFLLYSGRYAAMGTIPLDITLFSLLPLYIRIQIIREGIPVYVQDRDILFDLVLITNREWDDFEQSYRIMIK